MKLYFHSSSFPSVKGAVCINVGYRGGRDLHGIPKPVVTFYQAMKIFLVIYHAAKTFCHKSLQVPDAKLELTKNKHNKNVICNMIEYKKIKILKITWQPVRKRSFGTFYLNIE